MTTNLEEEDTWICPNILYDFWMSRLSGTEWKIISVLCHRSIRYKGNDLLRSISIADISHATNIGLRTIRPSMKKLVALGLAKKTPMILRPHVVSYLLDNLEAKDKTE